jgi:CBS domain containing-hemolysin-like protein
VRPVTDLLQPVVTVPRSVSAEHLLHTLREQQAHLAIVVDEFGSVEGLVTLQDVLEEVLGEVADEFKTPAHMERLPDGRVRLPGSMRVDEAEPWLSAPRKKGAETLGGYVLDVLGHLPSSGEQVTINGVTVEVERTDRRAVASVLVTPLASRSESCHG